MQVAVNNKEEADNKISRKGFFYVASGLGVPSIDMIAVEQKLSGFVLYMIKYQGNELTIRRLDQKLPVLEADAKALDFLWERVGRLVRSMMIDYGSFEVIFCRQGEIVSAVNFVDK